MWLCENSIRKHLKPEWAIFRNGTDGKIDFV